MWRAESGHHLHESLYDIKKQQTLRYLLSCACSCCALEREGAKNEEEENAFCDRCRIASLPSALPLFYCSEFLWFPRLLFSGVTDQSWLHSPDAPKNYIYDMIFADDEFDVSGRGSRLLVVLKRKGYGKNARNGFGSLVIKCDELISENYMEKNPNPPSKQHRNAPKRKNPILWYQFCDTSTSRKDILSVKWSLPLCLGTRVAAGVLIRGKGLFELVDQQYASAFQSLYDHFVHECTNYCQIGQSVRFWVTSYGELKAFVATSSTAMHSHPEWAELLSESYTPATLWSLRVIARRVGYFISDIGKETESINSLEMLYNSRKGRKGGAVSHSTHTTTTNANGGGGGKLLKSGVCMLCVLWVCVVCCVFRVAYVCCVCYGCVMGACCGCECVLCVCCGYVVSIY
jgi:hypothetical protein